MRIFLDFAFLSAINQPAHSSKLHEWAGIWISDWALNVVMLYEYLSLNKFLKGTKSLKPFSVSSFSATAM